ncbi:MAG: AmmeMemoRadiSam system protein B [Candidatus Omnitrophota bacterium]
MKTNRLIILFFLSGIFLIICFSPWGWTAQTGNIKKPDFAELFYPADPQRLENAIESYISKAYLAEVPHDIRGLISPHAGYVYSGPVAAYGYKSLLGKKYKTVIILAPSHNKFLEHIAVYANGAFETPLGKVKIDTEFTRALMADNRDVQHIPDVFNNEHSLEVQIPFLQKVLIDFKIVPIIISSHSLSMCDSLAKSLVKTMGERNDVLILASSDMSHFHNQEIAAQIDQETISLIEDFNVSKLFQQIQARKSELCGGDPVIALLLAMKSLNATDVQLLKYATSYNTTGSNDKRVVGYSSIIFSLSANLSGREGSSHMLTQEQRTKLLKIAKDSIREYVLTHKRIIIEENDPALLQKQGAFVTIKKNGQLRGCIGRIVADTSLANTVSEMAIQAATSDPRFAALDKNELDLITLEISAMSPIKQIDTIEEIVVGKHGLIIQKGFSSGLLLPQVATEYNWTREEFLQQTCRKAGLRAEDWKNNAQIYIFSAEVFKEKELK